mmetsp:Transcript_31438/g.36246  ORF Transcript_31438/g.36246 Transcript_31438/m.36246 type:complete len:201 (+) Transcript_31438:687-1289(+)
MPISTGSSNNPIAFLPSGLYASNRMPCDFTSFSSSTRWLYGCTSTWSTTGRTLAYASSSFKCRGPKLETPSCRSRSRASQVCLRSFDYLAMAPGLVFRYERARPMNEHEINASLEIAEILERLAHGLDGWFIPHVIDLHLGRHKHILPLQLPGYKRGFESVPDAGFAAVFLRRVEEPIPGIDRELDVFLRVWRARAESYR